VTYRVRVFLLMGGVLGAVLLFAGWWARGALEAPRAAFEEDRLRRDFELVRLLVESGDPDRAARPTFRDRARDLSEQLDLRVTFVGLDGQVLGDSRVPGGEVRGMEFHGGRPEIVLALEAPGVHFVERTSPTEGTLNLYVAGMVSVAGEAEPVVLRLSAPKDQFLAPYGRLPTFLLLLGLGALLMSGMALQALDRSFRRGVLAVESRVQRLGGEEDRSTSNIDRSGFDPTSVKLPPELRSLSESVTRLGDELRGRVREMTRERTEVLALVESIAEGVLALTEDARVLRINRAGLALLEILPPPPFAPIGTLVRHPGLRDYLEEAVVLPLPPKEFAVAERTLRVSTSTLEGGGAVVTLLDVTDLRRMEQIRRDFVANASHELKTPLTAMRGFSETLLEDDVPDALRLQFLNSIRSNTVRMQNLVDDLLDLSRLESGTWALKEEMVNVGRLAEGVWRDSLESGEGKGIRFAVLGQGQVLADPQALHQIFRNLFDNALRFTPDGGTIEVRIVSRGPEARISVVDSGMGIPSAALPRIFERFYRVDPGRDRGAGGTGLGLAIVRHLVTAMGGEVSAESRLGEGTTIHFTLPRVEAVEPLAP